jgi:hypothetical protein
MRQQVLGKCRRNASKVKVKLTLEQAMKDQRENGGMVLLFL